MLRHTPKAAGPRWAGLGGRWEVRAVEWRHSPGDVAYFDEGWEPFGVTIDAQGKTIYHLRRALFTQ